MPDTDRYGNLIKKITVLEVYDELSKWTPEEVLVLCAIMITEHQQDWNEFKDRLKSDLQKGIKDAGKV